jgi:hypothetical protein
LRFGRLGLGGFLVNFPWLPFFLALTGLAGGILLLRRFEIAYKRNFLGLAITVVALILALGFLADQVKLEKPASRFGPIKPLYHGQFEGEDWVVGEVLSVGQDELEVETPEGNQAIVAWDEKTRLPLGEDFQTGDLVRAVGEWQDGVLKAEGIMRSAGGPPPHFDQGRVRGRRFYQ